MNEIKKTIRKFIIENFLFGEEDNLKGDTSFLEEGIIDSTGVLELIEFLEEQFDITVKDDEIIPENLDSLNNLEKFLTRVEAK
ncbi:acyl carrier protein [Desulfocicer vacuolatum DSM 3385]|uniref:Acyl carrier protein n=1 Tax=Desulfocicer vacuolatum DSM 3385 TaxID=1121400 RepID=A0A1W2D636_9BACT|nr:acyl carrier protein [Desulfocicer vacuolatum]SMC92522.1 acyl carrier protein [Desulfocicer vacuolatum DSM 3385]